MGKGTDATLTSNGTPDSTSVAVCMEPLFNMEVSLFWKLSGVLQQFGKMSFLIKSITCVCESYSEHIIVMPTFNDNITTIDHFNCTHQMSSMVLNQLHGLRSHATL